jgi:uncharacterized protein (AIM24 family)
MEVAMLNAEQMEVLEQEETGDGSVVEVLQYGKLRGSADVRTAESLFYASQGGMHLKMVRIRLNQSSVRVERGALYFMKGRLDMRASTGGGIMKGLTRKLVSGESFFVNEIHGTGDIYLEPTFGHFFLHRIDEREGGIIVDKSLFYAGTAGLDISVGRQKTISATLFSEETYFQTKISGRGVAVIYSPVPREELIRVELNDEKLLVDGNFVLMRSERLAYRVEKSSKGWLSTSVSSEGLLQTFEGGGFVWLAPTKGVYEKLSSAEGLLALATPPGLAETEPAEEEEPLEDATTEMAEA